MFQRPIVKTIQTVLRESDIGRNFFKSVATPNTLRNILNQAYGYERTSKSVDDECIKTILEPGLQPGAAEVFLDFISYSGGPLPEELLPKVTCPVRFLWGVNDPWEPMSQAKELYFGDTPGVNRFSCVDEFVELQGAGHCPMDQVPAAVNAEILRFLREKINVQTM
jgi:pimeloyl-ACP methyl ester carboxylesterase